MSRDLYSIYLGKAKKVIYLNLLNINGQWMKAPVHEDVVRGYHYCKCVLVCMANRNVDRQYVSPIIDTWQKLEDMHCDQNIYRLMAIKAQDTSALTMAMAVVGASGSPFTLDHRIDPLPYRFSLGYKSPGRAVIAKFFGCEASSGNLPISGLDFDAVLSAPRDLAFIRVKNYITRQEIETFHNMTRFIDSDTCFHSDAFSFDPGAWAGVRGVGMKRRHLFLGAEVALKNGGQIPEERQLLDIAAKYNIHLYHRRGNAFQYIPPSGLQPLTSDEKARIELEEQWMLSNPPAKNAYGPPSRS